MAKKILAVGLKKVSYAVVAEEGVPPTFTDIDVIHNDTFEYSNTEATYEDYINMLTKKRYYRRKTEDSESTVTFSIGAYDFDLKKVFMGGTATATKWTPATDGGEINLAIRVVTEDDVQITFPYSSISASHTRNQSALGLTITASPIEHPDGVTPSEEWEILAEG